MKKYTDPKIYHGGKNFDLSKRWYIYSQSPIHRTAESLQAHQDFSAVVIIGEPVLNV
ncbi:MAG: hypothetical protein LBT29_02210 [Flavobacteriaceae bacterium]|nr:hypothetical protein [Flavobacteriaceae bacterium]